MMITFQITREDLLAHLAAYNAQLGIIKNVYRRGFLWGPLLGLLAVAVFRPAADGVALVLVAICTVVGAAVWHLTWPSRLARANRALLDEGVMAKEIGTHTITVEPDGIHEVAEWGEVLRKWHVVTDVEEAPTHVFVYCAGQGPCIVVPRTAFASPSEQDEFVKAVRARGPISG